MIDNWSKPIRPSDEELDALLRIERDKLATNQIKVKEKNVPVFVAFEGWSAAGKGSVIGKIIKNMDPRFFKVESVKNPTPDELARPFLYRYFSRIPEAGRFTFLDGSWMREIVSEKVNEKISEKEYRRRIDSVRRFERTLADNGYLVMKYFMTIDEEEQRARLAELMAHKSTRWRVNEDDIYQNEHYSKYFKIYNQYLYDTNSSTSPWYIIDASDKKWAEYQVLQSLNKGIEIALRNNGNAMPLIQNVFPMVEAPKLAEISLDKELTEEEYSVLLKEKQKKLSKLHNILYKKKIPLIIAYEGWDAAGKGGNIKRITEALDARGFVVNPIASPEPHEKSRHFLWRFWTRLPKAGHIAIFDRTWYGRVMVERIEGFCSENDWQRAYNEINEFEKELTDWGAVVVKFWVQIDKDTQLERFTLRQNTPEKRWKITDEDWRNREKWDIYESAIDEMIVNTNTAYAPWHVLESNDKKYARIKALDIVISSIEERLNQE